MTFGQCLKQMLSVSGVRRAHLAEKLGYDLSYVSRWTNGVQVPSLKNNRDLLSKIVDAILECSLPDGLVRLAEHYGGQADADLHDVLLPLLQNAYFHIDSANTSDLDTTFNALLFPNARHIDPRYFKQGFLAAAAQNRKDILEAITVCRLSTYSNTDMGFFECVCSDEIPLKYSIMVHQLVDMADFKNCVCAYCAAICTFVRYRKGVLYTFYEYDDPKNGGIPPLYSYMLIEDQMRIVSYRNPFSETMDMVASYGDPRLFEEFSKLKSKLSALPKILKFYPLSQPMDTQFFFDYALAGDVQYLLSTMVPFCMPEKILHHLVPPADLSMATPLVLKLQKIYSAIPRHVIIYKSALINYVYNGEIYIYGRKHTLTVPERISHLEEITAHSKTGRTHLVILDDVNPILNREDTKLSLFISENVGFFACFEDTDTPIIRIRSLRTIEYFQQFVSTIRQLDGSICMSGECAHHFVERCVEMIRESSDPALS